MVFPAMGISIIHHTVNKMALRTSYLYNGYSYTSSESNFRVPKLSFCIKSFNCIKSLKIILLKLLPYLPLSQGPTTVYFHFVAKWRPDNVPPYFIYYNFTCPSGNWTVPAKFFFFLQPAASIIFKHCNDRDHFVNAPSQWQTTLTSSLIGWAHSQNGPWMS